ncbi:hypothetical protein [Brevundimonas balnearis]|uniref:Uncharacterized protein n=1 Tax=Brevundimonas balnearis TaxID=1572858 RepID=A0ABV6R166_9CAUL
MSAKPDAVNRYAYETPPFLSPALSADLDSDSPSADALEWLRSLHEARVADPRPRLTSEQVGENLRARHAARLRRDEV